MSLQIMQLTSERDTLLQQVDMLRIKLANLEGEFDRERKNSSMLQVYRLVPMLSLFTVEKHLDYVDFY